MINTTFEIFKKTVEKVKPLATGDNIKKGNDSRPYTRSTGNPSNFQLSKYGNSSSRSYNVSRSSSESIIPVFGDIV